MMRVALIGLGMVAKTHLATIRDAEGVVLSGILGRDAAKTDAFARTAAKELGYPVHQYATLSELTQSDDVDFVIVLTPPNARHDFISACCAAKLPVLMEKPIERTLAAARSIVDLSTSSNTPLGICFQHRARAASQALKTTLEQNQLGDIVSVEIRVPWWRDQGYYDEPGRGTYDRDGGGVMINQAIHTLDLALWALGPFASVQSLMATTDLHKMEAEDWAAALFTTASGAVGSLVATTNAFPGSAESISVQGTKAAAHLESGVLTIAYLDGRKETLGATATTGSGADPMAFTHEWHQSILENFVAHIRDDTPLIASGNSALEAHRVIDAMERSNKSGQREAIM